MNIRSSVARGIPVVSDASGHTVAFLDTPLIQPDTGRILGFFVLPMMAGVDSVLFLQCIDILAWGTKVHVRSEDRLAPPEELIRYAPSFNDVRTFLGQQIRTMETKKKIGICADVQFNTRNFTVEWLFPRTLFFFSAQPIPIAEIIQVTEEAIWIREPLKALKERKSEQTQVLSPAVLADVATRAGERTL